MSSVCIARIPSGNSYRQILSIHLFYNIYYFILIILRSVPEFNVIVFCYNFAQTMNCESDRTLEEFLSIQTYAYTRIYCIFQSLSFPILLLIIDINSYDCSWSPVEMWCSRVLPTISTMRARKNITHTTNGCVSCCSSRYVRYCETKIFLFINVYVGCYQNANGEGETFQQMKKMCVIYFQLIYDNDSNWDAFMHFWKLKHTQTIRHS